MSTSTLLLGSQEKKKITDINHISFTRIWPSIWLCPLQHKNIGDDEKIDEMFSVEFWENSFVGKYYVSAFSFSSLKLALLIHEVSRMSIVGPLCLCC